MIVQLGTGYIGTSAQLASRRASGPPTLIIARDPQALRVAAGLGGGLGALSAGLKASAAGTRLLGVAETGITAIEAVLADMKTAASAAKAAGLSNMERAVLHSGFDALRAEIADIVDRTLVDGVKSLDGGGGASRSFSFGTGAGGEPGADTVVTISAATAAQLAGGLDTADLLTQASATSAETLVVTAQEAAAGIEAVLRADRTRLDAVAQVGGLAAASVGTVRDAGLEHQGIVDVAREASNRVALDGGLKVYGKDGGLKSGGVMSATLASSLDLSGTGAVDAEGAQNEAKRHQPADRDGMGSKRTAVDINA